MEKLLRLLNIYAHAFLETNLRFTYDGNHLRVQGDEIGPYVAESIVINKKFGFIERLVKNDKIKSEYISGGTILANNHQYITYTESEDLIMQLSIQDSPIEYLCIILKE